MRRFTRISSGAGDGGPWHAARSGRPACRLMLGLPPPGASSSEPSCSRCSRDVSAGRAPASRWASATTGSRTRTTRPPSTTSSARASRTCRPRASSATSTRSPASIRRSRRAAAARGAASRSGRWAGAGTRRATTTSSGTPRSRAHSVLAQLQLDFIWYELTTFRATATRELRAATNVTEARHRLPGLLRESAAPATRRTASPTPRRRSPTSAAATRRPPPPGGAARSRASRGPASSRPRAPA